MFLVILQVDTLVSIIVPVDLILLAETDSM